MILRKLFSIPALLLLPAVNLSGQPAPKSPAVTFNPQQESIIEQPSSPVLAVKWLNGRQLSVIRTIKITSVDHVQHIRRILTKDIKIIYDPTETQYIETIKSIDYVTTRKDDPQVIVIQDLDGTKVSDNIPTEVDKKIPLTVNYSPAPYQAFTVRKEKWPALSRSEVVHTYRSYCHPRVYLEGALEPAMSVRSLVVRTTQFTSRNQLDIRSRGEKAVPDLSWRFRLGFPVLKTNSSFYIDYIRLKQGFETEGHDIEWQSGLPTVDPAKNIGYHVTSNSWGIGYSYSPFAARVAFTADIGLIYNWISRSGDIQFKNPGLGSRLAIGSKFTILPFLDLRVMPTWKANFSILRSNENYDRKAEIIGTRLHNFGLSVSARWYLMTKDKP